MLPARSPPPLNADCLLLVFQFLTARIPWFYPIIRINKIWYTGRTSDLISCACVCREWSQVAIPLLWQQPFANDTVEPRHMVLIKTCMQCLDDSDVQEVLRPLGMHLTNNDDNISSILSNNVYTQLHTTIARQISQQISSTISGVSTVASGIVNVRRKNQLQHSQQQHQYQYQDQQRQRQHHDNHQQHDNHQHQQQQQQQQQRTSFRYLGLIKEVDYGMLCIIAYNWLSQKKSAAVATVNATSCAATQRWRKRLNRAVVRMSSRTLPDSTDPPSESLMTIAAQQLATKIVRRCPNLLNLIITDRILKDYSLSHQLNCIPPVIELFANIAILEWTINIEFSDVSLAKLAAVSRNILVLLIKGYVHNDEVGCDKIDAAVATLVCAQRNLTRLILDYNSNNWRYTLDAVAETQSQSLRSMYFTYTIFDERYALRALAGCTNLEDLVFSHCVNLSPTVISPLLTAPWNNMKCLEFTSTHVSSDAIDTMMRNAGASLHIACFAGAPSLYRCVEQRCTNVTSLHTSVLSAEYEPFRQLLRALAPQLRQFGIHAVDRNEPSDWLLYHLKTIQFPRLLHFIYISAMEFSAEALSDFLTDVRIPQIIFLQFSVSCGFTERHYEVVLDRVGDYLQELYVCADQMPNEESEIISRVKDTIEYFEFVPLGTST